MTKITKKTPQLDAVAKLVAEIGGKYELVVEPEGPEDADKIEWLRGKGRAFLRVTPAMQQQIARFMKAEREFEPTAPASKLLDAGAQGAKASVMLRFANNGNDVVLRPLTAKYLARKLARGLDRRVGVATGALLNNLNRARWRFVKR